MAGQYNELNEKNNNICFTSLSLVKRLFGFYYKRNTYILQKFKNFRKVQMETQSPSRPAAPRNNTGPPSAVAGCKHGRGTGQQRRRPEKGGMSRLVDGGALGLCRGRLAHSAPRFTRRLTSVSCNVATDQKIQVLWQQDWIKKKLLQLPRKALCVENILKTKNVFGSHAAPVMPHEPSGRQPSLPPPPTDCPALTARSRASGLKEASGLLLSACPVFCGSSHQNQ